MSGLKLLSFREYGSETFIHAEYIPWNENNILYFSLLRIDIAKIFCTSIFKYVEDFNNACVMSKTLGMLAEMLSW